MLRSIGVIVLVIGLSIGSSVSAQDYNTAIGVRGGFYNGLTIKHFIGSKAALEGIFSSRWRGFNITGLYEINNPIAEVAGLNWYYGVGGHIGFWNGRYVHWKDDYNDHTVIGADGILGLEYNFSEIPINLSIDWKPAINLVGYNGFWGDGGAFSIRYILGRRVASE